MFQIVFVFGKNGHKKTACTFVQTVCNIYSFLPQIGQKLMGTFLNMRSSSAPSNHTVTFNVFLRGSICPLHPSDVIVILRHVMVSSEWKTTSGKFSSFPCNVQNLHSPSISLPLIPKILAIFCLLFFS